MAVTCSERNRAFLISLGADEVIDYETTDFSKVLNNFDVVFNSVSAEEKSYSILKRGGRYLSITEISQSLSVPLIENYGVIANKFLFHADAVQLQQIVELIEAGEIKLFIDKTFSFKDAKEALKYQQLGHSKGKNIFVWD